MVGYYVKRTHAEQFQRLQAPISSGMWVDAAEITSSHLEQLIATFTLDASIVRDVTDKQELSRVEFSGKDTYVFVRLPHLQSSGKVITHPMLCIIHESNFFTISTKMTVAPSEAAMHARIITSKQSTNLLLGVIASAVSQYEQALKHTERSIDDTGARLKSREITNQDFIHFVIVEDNLTTCRMNLSGILAALQRLKDTTRTALTHQHLEMLDDISLQVQQLLVAVESYRGRVDSIRSAYSTVANNTLNQRMKTLTVFTVLIALPNLFYGMYGMNVTGLPFHDKPWGYLFVLAISICITSILYIFAKLLKVF